MYHRSCFIEADKEREIEREKENEREREIMRGSEKERRGVTGKYNAANRVKDKKSRRIRPTMHKAHTSVFYDVLYRLIIESVEITIGETTSHVHTTTH